MNEVHVNAGWVVPYKLQNNNFYQVWFFQENIFLTSFIIFFIIYFLHILFSSFFYLEPSLPPPTNIRVTSPDRETLLIRWTVS